MILRTGLTGGLASGKSTIARIFASLGCVIIDADQIVARLYEPGQAGHEALVRTYGREILRPDDTVDRPKLAAIAFASDDSAKALNALIHPIVHAEQDRLMRAEEERAGGDRIVIIEATLLIEAGGRDRFDRIVVVDVDPEIQLARAVARGMTHEDAARRIAHQMTREERHHHADYIIDNNGDLRVAEVETRRVFEALERDLLLRESEGE